MNTATWASMEADSGGKDTYLPELTWCVSASDEHAAFVHKIAQLIKESRVGFEALWDSQGHIVEVSVVFKDAR